MTPADPFTSLSQFPISKLPKWVRDYVEAEAHVLQVDPLVIALSVLGGVALAIQSKAELAVRAGWVEPLCIWIMTSLRSGNRKSPALFNPLAPIQDYERSVRSERESYRRKLEERANSFAGTKGAVGKAAPYLAAMPPDFSLFGVDATPEALAIALGRHNECYGVVSDEPSSLQAVLDGIYHNGRSNPAIYLSAYSGKLFRRERVKGDPVFLEKPRLSMILSAQPAVFSSLAKQARLADLGFVARFLLAEPEDKLGYREVHSDIVPPEIADAYYLNMRAIAYALDVEEWPSLAIEDPEPWPTGPRKMRTLHLSPEARALHTQTEASIEPLLREGAALGELSDLGAKLSGNIARCAALLHALEEPENWWQRTVSPSAMRTAIEIGRFELGQLVNIFGEAARDRATEELADYVYGRMRKLGANGAAGVVGWSSLSRAVIQGGGRGRIQDRETLKEIVEFLVERGDVVPDRTGRGEAWRLVSGSPSAATPAASVHA